MRVHVETYSFDELEPTISWIKGGPEPQTGGTPYRQSGGHLSPEGECFAPAEHDDEPVRNHDVGHSPMEKREGCEALSGETRLGAIQRSPPVDNVRET